MKLTKVKVNNYRSIAELTLEFDHGCQALIGLNESGKSNILRALQLVDPSVTTNPGDLRIERKGEDEVSSGSVEFMFELEEKDIKPIQSVALAAVEPGSKNEVFCLDGKVLLNAAQFCARRSPPASE